ncbi:MAG: energy-coupling factor ABC transporter substrate-binding protein [Clostridia bacterium]|jgi:cobalt/nickel transport protein|nr:energy-coupling factor ABC transporter substrate-binding protein [Clostridia bacterium]MDD4571335.1 energy-coupling factor ABC transporter substrate-binding protein [Clostridia bacterium]
MSLLKKNIILLVIAVLIAILPLTLLKDAEFAGADGLAEDAIIQISPDYQPWFDSIIELPSGEIESLLFCIQAIIGSGIIFFILGRMTAEPKKEEKDDN